MRRMLVLPLVTLIFGCGQADKSAGRGEGAVPAESPIHVAAPAESSISVAAPQRIYSSSAPSCSDSAVQDKVIDLLAATRELEPALDEKVEVSLNSWALGVSEKWLKAEWNTYDAICVPLSEVYLDILRQGFARRDALNSPKRAVEPEPGNYASIEEANSFNVECVAKREAERVRRGDATTDPRENVRNIREKADGYRDELLSQVRRSLSPQWKLGSIRTQMSNEGNRSSLCEAFAYFTTDSIEPIRAAANAEPDAIFQSGLERLIKELESTENQSAKFAVMYSAQITDSGDEVIVKVEHSETVNN